MEADQAALLSLNVAIGDLQRVVGPDQRVSAPSDMLFQNPGPTAGAGRARWYGVWDTSNYDPSMPDSKSFLRWLVSSSNATGGTVDTSDVTEVENASGTDEVTIFEGVDSDSSVRVPKVAIGDSSAYQKYYAYWIDDEGVKANLAWDEGEFTDDERAQVARLAASPGADFGVFEGPFAGMSYPIQFGGANAWLESLNKANSVRDLPSVTSTSVDQVEWLRENRHDMTLGAFGLLADVKNGGLRADLGIAFEMDGDKNFDLNSAESNFVNPPTNFIRQYGVFAGQNLEEDVFTSLSSAGSIRAIARYVYADTNQAGFTFSDDLASYTDRFGRDLTVRGPTWFSLREYGNMYKRLKGSGGDYEFGARAFLPQNKSMIQSHAVSLKGNSGFVNLPSLEQMEGHYDRYYIDANNGHIVERPYQNNYMPVLLGIASTLSVTSVGSGADEILAVSIDPIFFLWNPYNQRLVTDRLGVGFRTASPGALAIWYDGTEAPKSPADVDELLARSSGVTGGIGTSNRFSLAMTDIELEPGEVKIYYPTSDTSRLSDASRHPYNTEAFEKDNDVISTDSGLLITHLPRPGGGWGQVKLSDFTDRVQIAYGLRSNITGGRVHTFLGDPSESVAIYRKEDNWGPGGYALHSDFSHYPSASSAFVFEPNVAVNSMTAADAIEFSKASISSGVTGVASKQFFAAFSILNSPAGSTLNPTEIFAQFNPLAMNSFGNYDESRVGAWNQEGRFITENFADHSLALEAAGIVLPFASEALSNGYWGSNYGDSSGFGSTHVPVLDIPTAPLLSLAQFSHANLGLRSNASLHAVGNSFASVFVDPVSPYGELQESLNHNPGPINAEDVSWLLNDALFDGYYLSGIAPAFTISPSGYSATGTIRDTLERFYEETGSDFRTAQANPVLVPYIPAGKTVAEVINELDSNTGNLNPKSDAACYQRLGAYSLVDGAFNVNSTSVAAWAALLRANRGLDVDFVGGSTDSNGSATPFPRSTLPVDSSGSENYWSGLERLSDDQIWNDGGTPNDTADDSGLAYEIVKQVKLRGPFMSLSDFVNHRVGLPKNDVTHYLGALQAAIEASGINSAVDSGAGGENVNYGSSNFSSSMSNPISGTRKSTRGIYTDITQADLLTPLAPRLSARSDTFKVRGYGEVRSLDGSTVIAQSVCEAVVQRIPDYVDTVTDPANNEAWDVDSLNTTNEAFGRRFKVVQFRWLDQNEI